LFVVVCGGKGWILLQTSQAPMLGFGDYEN